MLVSEILGWYWLITWDNAKPADSSAILRALKRLGRVKPVQTKTTVLLAPRAGVGWRQIRAAITASMDPVKGNATYANLRTQTAWQWSPKRGWHHA